MGLATVIIKDDGTTEPTGRVHPAYKRIPKNFLPNNLFRMNPYNDGLKIGEY